MRIWKLSLVIMLGLFWTPLSAQNLEEGAETFHIYCAACHGTQARGNGPMSPILTIMPTDLTLLKAENNGVFPRNWVMAKIDGRDPLLAHGSPMPLFGEYFEGKGVTIRGEDGTLFMTSQPIVDLIAYLESIQDQ